MTEATNQRGETLLHFPTPTTLQETPSTGGNISRELARARQDLEDCQNCNGVCPHLDYIKPTIRTVNGVTTIDYPLCDFGERRKQNRNKPKAETIFGGGLVPFVKQIFGEGATVAQANVNARIEKIAPRIRQQYGVVSLADVKAIDAAERELAECNDCTGEPCRKSQNHCVQPVIDARHYVDGNLSIPWALCPYARHRELLKQCSNAQIPLMYTGKTFGDYDVTHDNRRAVGLAHWFIENKPTKGLYLHGECGTGKTFLAAIIAQDFMLDFKTVVFGDVPFLMEQIKRSFDGGENPFDRYCDCDLLVLDDIGAGYLTDWNVGQLYQILNARYSLNKPIIATSNYDLDELERTLSNFGKVTAKRITSRLSAMCTAAFLGTNDRRR